MARRPPGSTPPSRRAHTSRACRRSSTCSTSSVARPRTCCTSPRACATTSCPPTTWASATRSSSRAAMSPATRRMVIARSPTSAGCPRSWASDPTHRVKLESYWLDSAPPFRGAAGAPLDSLGRVDVAIVGGGFTGLSAALALAKRNASVVVLEAGRVAGEASGRNGGHCSNGVAHDYAGLVRRFGEAKARAMYRDFDAAVDTVEKTVREESIDCDFVRSGKLKLAAKPHHFANLVKTFEVLGRARHHGMWL